MQQIESINKDSEDIHNERDNLLEYVKELEADKSKLEENVSVLQ